MTPVANTPIARAAAIAAASASGDTAYARELANELGVPGAAAVDPAALVRALIALLRERGDRVPPALARLAAERGVAMADLARDLADSDIESHSRVPMWLPVSLAVLTFASMGAAIYVGRHSLGFIDPAPDCAPPAGATDIGAVRYDDACHVLSWQTVAGATWILERDSDGTPTLATRSAPKSIRVLELAADGTVSGTRGAVPPAELAALTAELVPMLAPTAPTPGR